MGTNANFSCILNISTLHFQFTRIAKIEYEHNILKFNKQCKEIRCTKNKTINCIGLPLQLAILPWRLRSITQKYACIEKKNKVKLNPKLNFAHICMNKVKNLSTYLRSYNNYNALRHASIQVLTLIGSN